MEDVYVFKPGREPLKKGFQLLKSSLEDKGLFRDKQLAVKKVPMELAKSALLEIIAYHKNYAKSISTVYSEIE